MLKHKRTVVGDALWPTHPTMGLSALLCGKPHTPIHYHDDDVDDEDDEDADDGDNCYC